VCKGTNNWTNLTLLPNHSLKNKKPFNENSTSHKIPYALFRTFLSVSSKVYYVLFFWWWCYKYRSSGHRDGRVLILYYRYRYRNQVPGHNGREGFLLGGGSV
jgi:hypothetical protein